MTENQAAEEFSHFQEGQACNSNGEPIFWYPLDRKWYKQPEVSPEDLAAYDKDAQRLMEDLAPGESMRWADALNAAASMAKLKAEWESEPPTL